MADTLEGLWTEQLAVPPPDDGPSPTARGWLLDAGVAETLAPFVSVHGVGRGDLVRIRGLDGDAARTLLSQLPERELDERQNDSPTMRCLLTSIATHPQVRGIGYVVGPDRADERVSLEGVLIDDVDLLAFVPDITLGPVAPLVDDLDEELREQYHAHRFGCVRCSVDRQRWHAARHRYGLHDALRSPTEITVEGRFGGDHLRLWWT